MTQSDSLYFALLRPAVIHMLRAAGFYGARPSVVDALTDLCARFLILTASRTAQFARDRSQETVDQLPEGALEQPTSPAPTLSDIRNALSSIAFFTSSMTPSEEHWHELLRRPLSSYPHSARDKIRQQRDTEDVADVKEFVDWATGASAKEMRRIAGLAQDEGPTASGPATTTNLKIPEAPPQSLGLPREDYLTFLKKKQGKGGTGDGSRFAGTVLGGPATIEEQEELKLEGGPVSIKEWAREMAQRKPVGDAGHEENTAPSTSGNSKKRKVSPV